MRTSISQPKSRAKKTVLGIGTVAALGVAVVPVASSFAETKSLDINYNVADNLSLTLSSNEAVVVDGSTAPTTTATVAGNSVYNLVVIDQDNDNAMVNGTGGRIDAVSSADGVSTLTAGTWGIKTAITAGQGTTTLDSTKYYGVPARTTTTNQQTSEVEDTSVPLTLMSRESLTDEGITGDIATITYGVQKKTTQAAGTYNDTIVYTVSPMVVPDAYYYKLTNVSPSVASTSAGTTVTITSDIPSTSTVTVDSIKLKQTGNSTEYTCTNPQATVDGDYYKFTCVTPEISAAQYDIAVNLTIDNTTLTMTKSNAITVPITASIKWMYPTKMLTTGTQDKLVIATNNYSIPTTATAEVTVDGSTCTNPQIVEGGPSTSSSTSAKYKYITCSAPAMSAGNHDVVATVTNGNTVYAFIGKSINYTTDTITNRLTSIPETTTGAGNHSMQKINELDTNGPDSSKTFCANSTTPVLGDAVELVPTATLTDERDGQQYTVRKLADGNCWMTENLRYGAKTNGEINEDLADSTNITSANTDNPQTNFSIPTSRISNAEKCGSNFSNGNQTSPSLCIYQANTANEYDALNNTKYGVLYNYCAATGGTICNGETVDAQGSICPANWKLPAMDGDPSTTTSIETATKDGSVKSYNNLLNNYDVNYKGGTYDSEFSKLTTNSLDFVRAGSANTGSLYYRTAFGVGLYWASTAYSGSNSAYYLYLNSGRVYRSYSYRYLGYSVRCVAS